LGEDVVIGPASVIGPGVRLAEGVRVGPHCVLEGPTWVGASCVLTSHVALGTAPQDLKYDGEPTELKLGGRNTLREFCPVNRGTVTGIGKTVIGDDNRFMTGAHVAHDCEVGDGTVFANNATLGGHVVVSEQATLGAFSAVHQFCRVGEHAFVGGFTVATKDVLPFMRTVGGRGEVTAYGPNRIGLERKGMASDAIKALGDAFRQLRRPGGSKPAVVEALREEHGSVAEVCRLLDFVAQARDARGFHT